MKIAQPWFLFALGSAFFAGLTAILGKVGVAGINSNLATLFRTFVVLVFAAAIVIARGEFSGATSISAKSWIFLTLSGFATGASWLCYYRALQMAPASQVAPVDKLSVVVAIVLGFLVLGEPMTPRLLVGAALIVGGTLTIAG